MGVGFVCGRGAWAKEASKRAEEDACLPRYGCPLALHCRQRTLLLAACRAVLYTPQHEHFGIVPLEVCWVLKQESYPHAQLPAEARGPLLKH